MNTGASNRVADVIADGLHDRGVSRIYTVAGESYLALLDAIFAHNGLEAITCRHEGAAAFMALADAKLSATIGVCAVNRGPGATNASIAVHAAYQDATPLVLLVGHVRTCDIGLDVFQELDCGPTFAAMSKGVWSVFEPSSAGRIMFRALETAVSGTPGPVVVMLPEDVLHRATDQPIAAAVPRLSPRPHPDEVAPCRQALLSARRPLVIAGRELDNERLLLRRFCEYFRVPVAVSNKHQDLFDNHHPLYAGHLNIATQPAQRALFLQADIVLAVGTRLRDLTSLRGRFPGPHQRLFQVHSDPRHLGDTGTCNWALACTSGGFLQTMMETSDATKGFARDPSWSSQVHDFEANQARWSLDDHEQTLEGNDADAGVPFAAVIKALDQYLPDDGIVTIDSGNFTSWLHRYLRFKESNRLLAIESSAMGFAVPSAISAALVMPERRIVAIVGDGGFLMTGAELATAVMYQLPILVIIANNGSYGTIRAHQERKFPARVVATTLQNPDFVQLAGAYGATGFRISRLADLPAVFERAWQQSGPVLLDVQLSLARISAYRDLADLASGS